MKKIAEDGAERYPELIYYRIRMSGSPLGGYLVGKYVGIEACCVFLSITSRSLVRENIIA